MKAADIDKAAQRVVDRIRASSSYTELSLESTSSDPASLGTNIGSSSTGELLTPPVKGKSDLATGLGATSSISDFGFATDPLDRINASNIYVNLLGSDVSDEDSNDGSEVESTNPGVVIKTAKAKGKKNWMIKRASTKPYSPRSMTS